MSDPEDREYVGRKMSEVSKPRFYGGLHPDTPIDRMPAPVYKSLASTEKIERVEFIIKQHIVICNVLTNQGHEVAVWKHKEFPASISIIDFLMNGNMETAMQWPEGRRE